MTFSYQNLSGRPPGALLTALSKVSRRVRSVQEQVEPYARAWGEANTAELEGEGPLWVALGDSMTQGIGAPRPELGYVGQLAGRLRADSEVFRLVNLSFSGARTQDVIDRQWPAALRLAGSRGLEIGLVTVLIGSNDLLRSQYRAALPATYRALVGALPAGAVLATLPNPRKAAVQLNTIAFDAAATGRARVADLRRMGIAWSLRGKLSPDFFHPNEHGYADLAESFVQAVGPSPFGR